MAENIPREFIELLLTKIDLVDLIHTYIPLHKKSGNNYFACCPFHNEKSASFSVSQAKQFYYCFGCGAHGNAVDFMIQYERLNFREAIEALARTAGMEVPLSAETKNKTASLAVLYSIMSNATHYYYNQMRTSKRAIAYLKKRHISGQIVQQFQIGYAPDSWHNLIEALGQQNTITKNKLLEAGLIIQKNQDVYYDRFRDRIIFPILDYRGRIIGLGGRIIDQGEPKYLNSPETPLFQKGHELYGLYQALKVNRQLKRILIVEGYMDVVALFQFGITYAAATMGTATTAHHFKRLSRYTSEIVFCFDGDQAGRTAAWRSLQVILPLMDDKLQVRYLFLPDAEDPDTLIRKEGKIIFEKRIDAAQSLSTFFFKTLSEQSDMSTMEGRARFASLAFDQIKQIPLGIFREILLDELEKRARVKLATFNTENNTSSSGLYSDTEKIKQDSQNIYPSAKLPNSTHRPSKLAAPLQLALTLLVQYPHLANNIPELMPAHAMTGFSFLLELVTVIHQKPTITTGGLIEHWRGQKEEAFVVKLAQIQHTFTEENAKHEFLGALRQLNLLWLEEEINGMLSKAAQEGLSDVEKAKLSNWINIKQSWKQALPTD